MRTSYRIFPLSFIILFLILFSTAQSQKNINHHFPRKFTGQWGGGTPWLLSQYDMVITLPEDSNRIKATKALSPNTYYLATRDWNGGGPFLRFPVPKGYLPSEYYLRSWVPQHNAWEPLSYFSGSNEFFANITRYCRPWKGKPFWQYIGDSLNNWVSWAAFDGVHSDGTFHRPLGGDQYQNQIDQNIDLDTNGVRDYLEHGVGTQDGYRAWEEGVWHEGYNLATKHMRDIWGSNQKLVAGWTIGSYNYVTSSGIDTLAVHYMNGSGWEYPFTHNHISARDYFADYKAICDAWDRNHAQNLPVLKYMCVNLSDVNIQGSQYNIDHLKNNYKFVREMIGWGCMVGAYVSFEDCYLTPTVPLDHHGSIIGYDEFKLDLGLPTGAPVQTNSCWIRGFDNGAVVMMPFDVTGSRTITLAQVQAATGYSGAYYRLFGAQDTAWNNGRQFDQVTITQTSYVPYSAGWKGLSGDAIFLTKARDTSIADIIIDDAPCPTTPGNEPAVMTGSGWMEDIAALSNFAHPAYSSTMNTGGTLYTHGAKSHYTTTSGDYVTYTPTLMRAGKYNVYEWHGWVGGSASSAAEAQNVPVVIKFGPGGTDTAHRTVNQRTGYGQWNLLGQWNFAQGTGSYVRFTNTGTDGPVIADAVRFVPVVTTGSEGQPVIKPTAPTPVNPSNGAVNQLTSVGLTWSTSSGADFYRLQIATDSSFTQVQTDDSTLAETAYQATGLLAGAAYWWHISAKNQAGSSQYSVAFHFQTAAPAQVPALVSPPNGATGEPTTVGLTWNASTGAVSYRLQLAVDSAFQQTRLDDSTITQTAYQATALLTGITYWWHVRAKNAAGSSQYSASYHFTTDALPAEVPALVSPANGAVNQPTTIGLSWDTCPGATAYRLQVATDTAFLQVTLDDSTITQTAYQASGFLSGTSYWWHVHARNAVGCGHYSAAYRFTTATITNSISISKKLIDFGKVALGSVQKDSIIVSNGTAQTLRITGIVLSAPQFVCSPTSASVDPGGKLTVSIEFQPPARSTYRGNFRFVDSLGLMKDTVNLSGQGVRPARIRHLPGSITFLNVPTGSDSTDYLKVYNDGDLPLTVYQAATDNPLFSISPTSAAIAPLDSQRFSVTVTASESPVDSGYILLVNNSGVSTDSAKIKIMRITNVKPEDSAPHTYVLENSYPNPFNPTTTIRYTLPVASTVILKVYNLLGQEVKTLMDGTEDSGPKAIIWDATDSRGMAVPSGIYIYRMQAVGIAVGIPFTSVKKMSLLR